MLMVTKFIFYYILLDRYWQKILKIKPEMPVIDPRVAIIVENNKKVWAFHSMMTNL